MMAVAAILPPAPAQNVDALSRHGGARLATCLLLAGAHVMSLSTLQLAGTGALVLLTVSANASQGPSLVLDEPLGAD